VIENVTNLDPANHPWMTAPGLAGLFAALDEDGGVARFVGGAVRDALLGREVSDVDLAVNVPPDKLMVLLEAADIRVVPTGVEHGTVTAVIDHRGYEITTLRQDVETHGRRATVAFTDDWQADAARRDFTMNALYVDRKGKLYDYFGGRRDLARGRVRFIGKPEERINEDYLRILRYFRFHAWFGRGEADGEALRACEKGADRLSTLSAERIWKEINKLLLADDPVPAWRLMLAHNILPSVLPEAKNVVRLAKVVKLEKSHAPPDSLRRLASLLVWGDAIAKSVAERLRFSTREAKKLQALGTLPARLQQNLTEKSLRRFLYEIGPEYMRDALFILAADEPVEDFESILALIGNWARPVFPLKGEDIMKLGVRLGPGVGEILREVETWWQEKDFRPTKEECLAEAKTLAELK